MGTIAYKSKEGKRLPGWTTVAGQNLGWGNRGLQWWYNDQGLKGRNMQEAQAEVTVPGTIAHELIEAYWKEEAADLSQYLKKDIDKAETSYLNFLHWIDNFKIKPVAIEPHLVSEIYQVGGTPDLIAESLNGLCLTDWKTGRIYESTICQLLFYAHLWCQNNPDRPLTGGFHLVRIPRNEEIPSFHHSYWAGFPPEATESIEAILTLRRCQGVLKKLL